MNWANKYAVIDPNIILHEFPKTILKVSLSTGELGTELNFLDINITINTNVDAKKPDQTIFLVDLIP